MVAISRTQRNRSSSVCFISQNATLTDYLLFLVPAPIGFSYDR